MTTQKTPTSADNERLGVYLAHFAHHLAEHLEDLEHHRVRETEAAELKRLLDEASASIEVSHQVIARALAQLGTHGSAKHGHSHGAHHHHHHGNGAHSHG